MIASAPVARSLDTVSLADLELEAALQSRREHKYLVPLESAEALLAKLDRDVRVLEIDGARSFHYESNYFDTPDLESYRATAHRRAKRFKVRTRSYLDSSTSLLEVKRRDRRGLTVKYRIPYEFDERALLTGEALDFLAEFDRIAEVRTELERSLTTRYERMTLLETATNSRVTIDADLTCIHPAGDIATIPGMAIIETKAIGSACLADHLLWAAHHRPVKISKYGTGLAATDTSLPSNKWHRVLDKHFATTTSEHINPLTEGWNHETQDRTGSHRTPVDARPARRV